MQHTVPHKTSIWFDAAAMRLEQRTAQPDGRYLCRSTELEPVQAAQLGIQMLREALLRDAGLIDPAADELTTIFQLACARANTAQEAAQGAIDSAAVIDPRRKLQ